MNRVKNQINQLEYIIHGTVSKRYTQCGKKNCKCAKNKDYWHGPYYIWTRKENGKTITKSLSKEQAKICKNGIENSKKLKKLIEKWIMLSTLDIEKYNQ